MLVSWSWEWASCTIFSRAVVDFEKIQKILSDVLTQSHHTFIIVSSTLNEKRCECINLKTYARSILKICYVRD